MHAASMLNYKQWHFIILISTLLFFSKDKIMKQTLWSSICWVTRSTSLLTGCKLLRVFSVLVSQPMNLLSSAWKLPARPTASSNFFFLSLARPHRCAHFCWRLVILCRMLEAGAPRDFSASLSAMSCEWEGKSMCSQAEVSTELMWENYLFDSPIW